MRSNSTTPTANLLQLFVERGEMSSAATSTLSVESSKPETATGASSQGLQTSKDVDVDDGLMRLRIKAEHAWDVASLVRL